jgi:hypothetical protein
MNQNPNDFAKIAQNLVTRTIAEQVRAAQRYYDLAVRYGRGELSPQNLYDESLRFASQEMGRYASDMAMLSLNYYNDWFALSQRYNNRFLEVMGSKPEQPAKETPSDISSTPAALKRVEMELHAPLGQEAVRSFVLENKRGGAADISFDISDFSGSSGAAPVHAPLQIEPSNFTLSAGQESTVTLRLFLQPGLFVEGERYFATVVVRGYDGLELGLTVWADSPPQPGVETASPVVATSAGQKPKTSRRKTS